MSPAFHEIRFPTAISRGARGGPERRTEIVALGSGFEERNTRWAHARRRYNAGYGVRSLDDIDAVVAFFEERRGRLYGFRWRDHADFKSCRPGLAVADGDQLIGTGDGTTAAFALRKRYGTGPSAYLRPIRKPVAGTVVVAVAGLRRTEVVDYLLDDTTGLVTFAPGAVPAAGAAVTAGFEFDTPARFDTDFLEIGLVGFNAGEVPDIPVVELRA